MRRIMRCSQADYIGLIPTPRLHGLFFLNLALSLQPMAERPAIE